MNLKPNDLTARPDSARGASDVVPGSIVSRFERTAALNPDRIALQDHAGQLTYRALNAVTSQLAQLILAKWPSEAGAPIAFLIDHENSAIVTLLAILKSGRPYLCIHSGNPPERIRALIEDAEPAGIIYSRRHQAAMQAALGEAVVDRSMCLDDAELKEDGPVFAAIDKGPSNPFGIFYTSGSTGAPKGLVIGNQHVEFTVNRHTQLWDITAEDRFSLLTSLSFSAAPGNVMTPLLNGAGLYLFDLKAESPESVLDWIESRRITILRVTPSLLRTIFEHVEADKVLPSLRLVTLGGERSRSGDFAIFKAHTLPHARLVTMLASTEAGTLTFHTLDHSTKVEDGYLPVGYPLAGKEILLLDPDGQPVPPGNTGEIVVRSRALALGYWRKPELTAERFQADPGDPEMRTLHTGDLGAWRPDGMLEFRGRIDTLVKVRGYRVELSAIEVLLHQHPLVESAVVVARPSKHEPDQMQLVAFVVLHPEGAIHADSLRLFLAQTLPDYSIPTFFVFLDQLPLNAHGKIDTKSLPEVPERRAPSGADLPLDEVEARLVEIWKDVLKLDNIGVNDNFFELGGDSLSVLSMTLETEKLLSRKVPRAFFQQPTIRNLAGMLHEKSEVDMRPIAAFNLSGHQMPISNPSWKRQLLVQRLIRQLRRHAKDLLMTSDEVFVFKWFLFQFIRNKPVREANELIFRLANYNSLLDSVFRRKHILFRKFLNSLGITPQHSLELFRANFTANLLFETLHTKRPFQEARNEGADHSSSSSTYFLDRQKLLDETPLDQLDQYFPVAGIHHLQDAINDKRGAILLAFHGTAENRVAHRILARRLSIARIQTITYHAPLEQSPFSGAGTHIPTIVAGSLYAEAAFHGQNLLQQGQVIHILGDTIATGPGRRYPLRIGDRVYTIKAGFAELALNTGAQVIPLFGRFVDRGRLLVEFLPALQAGIGSRDEQIQALLEQYEAFINATIRQYPEMINWRKMGKHFRLPRVGTTSDRVSAQLE